MIDNCTGIILAGGRNRRFNGENKALLSIEGRSIVSRIYDTMKELFEKIILVTNDPLPFLDFDVEIVSDVYPACCSLAGLHAGLFYSETDYSFLTACDIPFIKKDLIELLIRNIQRKKDVIIPRTTAGMEALCAVYSKICLKVMEESLKQCKFKITDTFSRLRVKYIEETVLRRTDPDLQSFFNINTPEDLEAARRMIGENNDNNGLAGKNKKTS